MRKQELTDKEKTTVQERTIQTLNLVSKVNGFNWKKLDKEVIMGMIGMYIEGVKYAREIAVKGGEK